jgi:hypothetical protein
LSDPAFVTTVPVGGVMGPTDIGSCAINKFFFSTHQECNEYCSKEWSRPKKALPERHLPKNALSYSTKTLNTQGTAVATSVSLLNNQMLLFDTVRNIFKIKRQLGILTARSINENVTKVRSILTNEQIDQQKYAQMQNTAEKLSQVV